MGCAEAAGVQPGAQTGGPAARKPSRGRLRAPGAWAALRIAPALAAAALLLPLLTTRPVRADVLPPCPGPAPRIEALGPHSWWMPAEPGEIGPGNRGQVVPRLAHRDAQGRLWLLGSGASPRLGAALACHLARRAGRPVSDVINPWPRPEHVMGNRAFPAARLWAHAEVAEAMAQRCPRCIARLRQQLGPRAGDLGPGLSALRLPRHTVDGPAGHLGPWHWWRLQRGAATPVTVWLLPAERLAWAPGLVWTDGPPELRDATLEALEPALQRVSELLAPPPAEPGSTAASAPPAPPRTLPPWRLLPEQGPLGDAAQLQTQRDYLTALREAIQAAQAAGRPETELPDGLPGVAPAWLAHPRHALNWQRAWRELEAASFDNPAP